MPVTKSKNLVHDTKGKKAYIVAVDMGYGHQRAVYPLRHLAAPFSNDCGSRDYVINANQYNGIPKHDRKKWEDSQKLYELISRFKSVPLIGNSIFDAMDYFQRIESFYPKRDQSSPTIQLKSIYGSIKRGWGKHLIQTLNQKPLPLITSFFIPAYFAEEHNYKGDIYLMCCDADVSRAWAPLHSVTSRIHYLVPNRRVKERLMQYGVKEGNIFITGFPLPKENIGGSSLKILKRSLAQRIHHLDPEHRYRRKYKHLLEQLSITLPSGCDEYCPVTITFAVGGAGAQRDVGITLLQSLHHEIDAGRIKLNLVAGSRRDVYEDYARAVERLHVKRKHRGNISVLYAERKVDYFEAFNEVLLETDILWTKPSELSFYAGLGLPIIMAPTIGSQEEFNKSWLLSIGAAFAQEDPQYAHEWLFDWLRSGWLAEAAMKGFLDAPRNGTYHVEDVVLRGKKSEIEDLHLL